MCVCVVNVYSGAFASLYINNSPVILTFNLKFLNLDSTLILKVKNFKNLGHY